jgi:hypothetical protein
MHLVDSWRLEISVRNERNPPSTAKDSADGEAQHGLVSSGEFGSALGTILADSVHGSVSWSHWEQTPTGEAAVFSYSVPRSASHFEVVGNNPLLDQGVPSAMNVQSRTGTPSIFMQPTYTKTSIINAKPGYHGSLWVDPSTGAVLRLTIEADLEPGDPFKRAEINVEYGPVEIGGSSFICPVRSLAYSIPVPGAQAASGNVATQSLNETLFTGYHRFAATTKILTDSAASGSGEPASGESKPQ